MSTGEMMVWIAMLLWACQGPDTLQEPLPDEAVVETVSDTLNDEDGDGFSTDPGSGPVDCDDTNADINPAAQEICDEIDNDCDGTTDNDAIDAETWYPDSDGDGYGDGSTPAAACDQLSGTVDNTDDCDDSEALAWTDADEVCDGVDNDCDGTIDGPDAIGASTWYADGDGDGYGDPALTEAACESPSGYANNPDDCDDTEARAWTGADEVCDSVDNDCDSATTEDGTVWFEATDGTGSDWTDAFTGDVDVDVEEDGALYICAGTWSVNLDIDVTGTLSVVGTAGAVDTILDGSSAGTVVQAGGGDISLVGLTIQNGEGDNEVDGRAAGGGIACLDNTTLSSSDLRIIDNNATYYGVGFTAVEACDISLEDVELSNNTALYGAGGFAFDGTLSLVDATVSNNSAAFYGGGFSLGSSTSGTLAVSLEDTMVSGNSATYSNGGGIWAIGDTTIECIGSKSANAGFYDNSAAYYGGAVFLSGYDPVLSSDLCDFGEDGTSDDNTPQDVHIYSSYNYDDDASFQCVKGTCK